MKDYYDEIFNTVTRIGEERLNRKRRILCRIRNTSIALSGVAAVFIIGLGIIKNDSIKNAATKFPKVEEIITESTTTAFETTSPVTTSADNENGFNSVTTKIESQISPDIVTTTQISSINISDTNTYSTSIITTDNIFTAASITESSAVTTENPVTTVVITSSATTETPVTAITEKTTTIDKIQTVTTTGNISHRPATIPTINENEYYFNIKVIDKNTKEKIDNVHLTLERQKAIIYDSWAHNYEFISERETVAEWNTSDVNPFISDTYNLIDDLVFFTAYKENHIINEYHYYDVIYFLTSDKLPDGYKDYSNDIISIEFNGSILGG